MILFLLVACSENPPFTNAILSTSSTSSPIALSPNGLTLWVVNPDANSVTAVDTTTLEARATIPVGIEPRSISVAPDGTVFVVNRASSNITVLRDSSRFDLNVGSEPGGLALSPSGQTAYITVSSQDELVVLDTKKLEITHRILTARVPWAVAVTNDGDSEDSDETIVLTHRFARLKSGGIEAKNDDKEGILTMLDAVTLTPRETRISAYKFGYANILDSLAIQDQTVFVTHLLNSPELPRDFETTVSGGLTPISLVTHQEISSQKLDLNEPDFSTPSNFPKVVAVTKDGKTAYVVLAGTNAVMGIDRSNPDTPKLIGFWATGKNPQGLVLSFDETRAYVMNELSRDISVLDLTDRKARKELTRVAVVTETLDPILLRGKILFNNANDPRLSHLGWLSCATCHPDGGTDGTTWVTPDGLRQTQPLWKLAGTAPFHASATRDEVEDFEHDIEGLMDGIGLAPGQAMPELGTPNTAHSSDLDALASYILNGIRVPNAPQNLDISAVSRGRIVFSNAGCAACHGGEHWTNSRLPSAPGMLNGQLEVIAALRDVGTLRQSDVLGSQGFDVPSLLGLHSSAPYLHDGSAKNLTTILENPKHTQVLLSLEERADLKVFLSSLDVNTVIITP